MSLQLVPNDNAHEARPGVWIFRGKSMVLLVIGVGVFVALFRILAAYDVDWPWALALSLVPLLGITAFVHFFVNSRPPSYAEDLFVWELWRFRSWLYMCGGLDKPVPLCVPQRTLPHPKE